MQRCAAHPRRAARREQAEVAQRRDQHVVRTHVRSVWPVADDAVRRCVQAAQGAREWGRLVARVHDAVGAAPPELQRNLRGSDRPNVGEGAAQRVRARAALWRPTDLCARERLQTVAERRTPLAEAAAVAGNVDEVPVACRHVRDRVEHGSSGKQRRMARHEQEALLAAHARTEGIDARAIDAEPWDRAGDDRGHTREVVDLARVAP